jgi:hypothetical protein
MEWRRWGKAGVTPKRTRTGATRGATGVSQGYRFAGQVLSSARVSVRVSV